MNTAEETYPFNTAHEVLSFAFAMEAKQVYAQGLNEGTGVGENMYDRIAEGMMLKSRCLRVAGYMGHRVIEAYYTVPTKELTHKKEENIKVLGQWIFSKTHRPQWLLVDAVRDWSGETSHHDQIWWAKQLNKTPKTIHRYWKSKDPKDNSVYHLMNEALTVALARITFNLREERIIP